MGFLDDARKKLADAVDKHGSKIDAGIDKAADMADKRTGGKYRGQIHGGVAKAKDALDKLDDRGDRRPGGPRDERGPDDDSPPPPPPPPPAPPTR